VPDWFAPVVTTVGVLTAAVLAFLGGRYAARQSAKAAARTAEVTSRQVDVGEWKSLLEEMRQNRVDDRKQIDDLIERVGRLEQSNKEKDNLFRALMAYTRTLLAWIHRVIPAETPPHPPTEFVDELVYITER
jgi:hypothetical protein